ncbi:hypothetical protein QQZ08_009269 [Neonectria magnoliae]|uniref:MFS transporter n=1 Tax=Neonectria magnoliae TaxID=2732573 RepID=A0ABR1HQA7_9HYPO
MARIRIPLLLMLLLGALTSLVAASSAPTFCKCTCFKNSTIIPLGPAESDGARQLRRANPELAPLDDDALLSRPHVVPRSKSKSCSECTKAFCLSQGIGFCKNAKEEDVTTMCFQRDSNKDRIIVWGFIIGTVGLMAWAAFKRVVRWREGNPVGRQTANYAPMPGNFR